VTTTALADFLADQLLELPAIPEVLPDTLDIWQAKAPAHKVAALALSSRPGGGSLTLRRLALEHSGMVSFGRVHYKVGAGQAGVPVCWCAGMLWCGVLACNHITWRTPTHTPLTPACTRHPPHQHTRH
jgi:hypothetical protein